MAMVSLKMDWAMACRKNPKPYTETDRKKRAKILFVRFFLFLRKIIAAMQRFPKKVRNPAIAK